MGRSLRSGRLQLTRLRAAYPGYRVWTDVTFAESSPGTAIPVVCVGNVDDCTTRIHYDERQRWRRVTTRDPMFSVGGVSVGDVGAHLEGDIEGCELRGDIPYVECRVRGVQRAIVLLEVPEDLGLSGDASIDEPTLSVLRVAEIEVRAAE